ncbi:MAG TPA: aspartate aminotransferase [Dehalococcoidia bacterium]|nr:aspartate aminotransferase [Dehalococcoidia bacterium]
MSIQPKPEIEKLEVCPHGGPNYAELRAMGITADEIIDFSVSSNPFSFPPEVRDVFDSVVIDRYPDSESTELKVCLSGKLGVPPDNILVGSGSIEIIRLIALAYFGHGDSVLILKPTFGEYEVACQIVGAEILEQWEKEEECFTVNIDETVALIQQHHPKGIFICNPNNPTGQYLSQQEIERVLEVSPQSLVILDEAYSAFTEGSWPSTELIPRGNVISVRSMTKDYALPGLRLGYAVASKKIIHDLRKVCPPWNINAVAQKAGVIALGDSSYLRQCEVKVRQVKQFLLSELGQIGFTVLPSKTNFFLVKVGNGRKFRACLLRHGILVRDCASFGLPEYVRIAARTMPECRRLITTLKTLGREGELGTSI